MSPTGEVSPHKLSQRQDDVMIGQVAAVLSDRMGAGPACIRALTVVVISAVLDEDSGEEATIVWSACGIPI